MRRAVMMVVAAAGALVSAAVLVREAVLAANGAVAWPLPSWWHDLVSGPDWRAAAAGAVACAIGGWCLWLGLGMLGAADRDEDAGVELGGAGASVLVTAGALERFVAQILTAGLAEVRGARVRLARSEGQVTARAAVTLVPTDLPRLHGRAREIIVRELSGATGLDTGELILEVDELVAGRGGDT